MTTSNARLPEWLYETLPYIYFTGGILVMFALQGGWAVFSGVMLILAGVLVTEMRRKYRKESWHSENGNGRHDKGRGVVSGSGPLQLVWSKTFESGNSGIDDQHRNLFKTANTLIDAIYANRPHEVIVMLVDLLFGEVKAHFAAEDAQLGSWDHPVAEQHKAGHEQLLRKGDELRARLGSRDLSYREVFNFFVNDLVLHHIVHDDRKYFHQV